ncbi:MAG TPA: acyltransferase [Dehalococcoidia bacterium]|nr:acyltransferase [Dehalococcoidia bacterium]
MIHPTAEVEPGAQVGAGTRIWHHAHVRAGAVIGANCILGYGVYVDAGVVIGDNCKLQNRVSVYHGVTIEDGVFVGPHVAFTNDKHPRAIRPDGALATDDDWMVSPILVRHGASIGANAVVLPGVTIGPWAMVGSGAVVTRDVPDHGIVVGNPARLTGYACRCGETLQPEGAGWRCPRCGDTHPFEPLETR